jgi:aminoglycoside 2''-phosphotransferase
MGTGYPPAIMKKGQQLQVDTEPMDVTPYKELIETSFPEIQIETWAFHLSGWDSVVLEVNDALMFRFPRPNRPDVEAQLEKEIALLPELAKALPLPIPQFDYLGDGSNGTGRRFVGYRKLAGVQLRGDHPALQRPQQIARQLGEFISCLHRFPVERAAQLKIAPVSAADWRQRYIDLYEQVRTDVLPLLEPALRAKAAALWEGFVAIDANFLFHPVLIHADLNNDHILYDEAGDTITGIIDWGDVKIGDPAMDFADLLHTYGREFVEVVLANYQLEQDATFWQRVSFYAAAMPFYEVLYGLIESDEAHVQHGLDGVRASL